MMPTFGRSCAVRRACGGLDARPKRYPGQIPGRSLSRISRAIFVDPGSSAESCVFGLPRPLRHIEPNELVADRAYRAARAWFAGWNGGDIEDPRVVQERATRAVIHEFERA